MENWEQLFNKHRTVNRKMYPEAVVSQPSVIVHQLVCPNGTVTISTTDLNRRNSSTVFKRGQRIQTFANSDDLQTTLNDFTMGIRIGSIEEKLGDTKIHLWYFACIKRGV